MPAYSFICLDAHIKVDRQPLVLRRKMTSISFLFVLIVLAFCAADPFACTRDRMMCGLFIVSPWTLLMLERMDMRIKFGAAKNLFLWVQRTAVGLSSLHLHLSKVVPSPLVHVHLGAVRMFLNRSFPEYTNLPPSNHSPHVFILVAIFSRFKRAPCEGQWPDPEAHQQGQRAQVQYSQARAQIRSSNVGGRSP